MIKPDFPTHRCRISDDWTYHQMKVVWMENDFLRIGILVGRGSDIFEFNYKPRNLNFLLRLEKDIHNPGLIVSQIRDTNNQMEDYYYGGWQEVLPNSAPGIYRNASLGQHGEVWMIPWKYAILENGPDRVALKCWTRPLRVPLLIEKTLTLQSDSSSLLIQESLTNEGKTDLDIMWGHHIAFGLPFLKEGGQIQTNAKNIVAEKNMPEPRMFLPEKVYEWPVAHNINGDEINAGVIPPEEETPYSELAYLSGFEKEAFYSISNQKKDLSFRVDWDPEIFKYLWYWQERYATREAPWWGNTYAIALEPWTTKHPADPMESIARGEFLKIKSGSPIKTEIRATVIDNKV